MKNLESTFCVRRILRGSGARYFVGSNVRLRGVIDESGVGGILNLCFWDTLNLLAFFWRKTKYAHDPFSG